jgi:branched-chain amino acid transport system substrate-binding protein
MTGLLKKSVAVAALLCAGLMGPATAADGVVKVGGILSLSGPAAPFGIPERDAVEILANKINAEGGVKGRKIEVIFHDDQSNPTEAARGATRLIQQEKVQAIIGSTLGTGTLALMPIAMNNKVPVLAPIGTIDATSKKHAFWPWLFRSAPTEEVILDGIMERGVFAPKRKRFAVMYQEDAYGKAGMEYALKLSKEKDIEVVASVGAPLNAIDLTSAATKIRNANPEVVLLETSAPALGAAFVRAAKQVGLNAPIIGSGSLNQRPFLDAAGPAGEGVQVVSLGNWDDPSEKQNALGDILRAAGKNPSGYGELLSSTGFLVLVEALKRIDGQPTGPAIRDAIETICDFKGTFIDGTICYSKDQHEGFSKDSLVTVEISNGKFKTVK